MGLLDDFKKRAASMAGMDTDEARKNVDSLKSNISEIGKQLKEGGKVVASQVHASAKGIQEGRRVSKDGAVDDATDSTANPKTDQGVLEHGSQPVSRTNRAENTTSSKISESTPDTSIKAPIIMERIKTLPKPVIGIALAIVAMLVVLIGAIGSCSGNADEPAPLANAPMHEIEIGVECESNLIFSTYNVDVYFDDQKLGTLPHGESENYAVNASEGAHTFRVTKENDESVEGHAEFEVAQKDAAYKYKIACKNDRIEIELISEEEQNQAFAEELRDIANQPGEKASTVIQQLQEKDYEAAGYSLVCMEADAELKDFSAEEYEVESGEVNESSKVITLHLKSTKPIQPSFEKEIAIRAAVVAMTNCFATDVFDKEGSYDTEKFHTFADLSGYYMSIEQEGQWVGVDESTWRVDGMRLEASEGLCLELSADVMFDGSNYVVHSVNVAYGSSFDDIDSGDDWSVSNETYEPSESLPFLTVSPGLIEEARNTEKESDKAEEKAAEEAAAAAEEAEEAEYTSWVESHFSFWSGKCDELVDLVKDQLNDERSFEHIETSYVALRDQETLDEMDSLITQAGGAGVEMNDVVVIMEFSAKNGFNATIKHQAVGVIRYSTDTVELVGIA